MMSALLKIMNIIGILVCIVSMMPSHAQTEFSTCLYDMERERPVPVTVYLPEKIGSQTNVVIFNHGYDKNKNPESKRTYSFLTRFLAQKGYYVISIQHELPNDPLLAMEGKLMETRMPNWKRGEENIIFTINQFKKIYPEFNWEKLVMMGHSNGGDMTMLMAAHHPGLLDKAISLDHLRMIVPKINHPRICTLRASDCVADPGVLPDPAEQKKHGIVVIQLNEIGHADMGDKGTSSQHERINKHILDFLNQ